MTRLFVISPPKTGGTVLTRMLCQHPDVELVRESYSVQPDHDSSIFNPESDKASTYYNLDTDTVKRWRSMVLSEDGDLVPRGWQQAMEELFEYVGDGASVVGDSWPLWCSVLDLIVKCYPDAKIIYGTRDPRGVYWTGETFMDRGIGGNVLAHLLQYDHEVFKRRELLDLFVCRLEDLASEPERVMEVMWEWVGVDPSKGWIEYDRDRDRWPRRWDWVPNATEPISMEHADRWRREMPPDVMRRVSDAALEYSQRHHYEPYAGPDVPPTEIARRFATGTPLRDLPAGSEKIVRQEMVRQQQLVGTAMTGMTAALHKIDEQVQSYVDDPVPPGYPREFRFGLAAGLGHAGELVSHIHNRVTAEMVGIEARPEEGETDGT